MRFSPNQFPSWLQEKNLSISQYTALAHVQADTIYGILRTPGCRPHYSTVWRLALVLECQVSDSANVF